MARAPPLPGTVSDKQRLPAFGTLPVSRVRPCAATEPHQASLVHSTSRPATLTRKMMNRTLATTTLTASRRRNTNLKTTCREEFPSQAGETTNVATTRVRKTKSTRNTPGRASSTMTSTQLSTTAKSRTSILGRIFWSVATTMKNHRNRTLKKNTHHWNGKENELPSGTPSRTRAPDDGCTLNVLDRPSPQKPERL